MLRILEEKGYLRHEHQGPRVVFPPTLPQKARRSALKQVVQTFFDGFLTEQAVSAPLDPSSSKLSDEEATRLCAIDRASAEGGALIMRMVLDNLDVSPGSPSGSRPRPRRPCCC